MTKDTVTVPAQGQFRAAGLTGHLRDWQEITQDPVTIQAIQGVKLPLRSAPPTRRPTREDLERRDVDPVVDTSIRELLELGAIQEIPRDTPVFLSRVFTVPKMERGQEYGRRFILNLKVSIERLPIILIFPVCKSLAHISHSLHKKDWSWERLAIYFCLSPNPCNSVQNSFHWKSCTNSNIILMQPLNKEYVLPTPFTMTGVYQMADILLEGDWAVKIDLSNGKNLT